MKKIILFIIAALLCLALVLSFGGCRKTEPEEGTTAVIDNSDGNGSEGKADVKTEIFTPEDVNGDEDPEEEETEEETEEATEEEETEEEKTEAPTSAPKTENTGTYSAGTSSKGYAIEVVDGITYVDGIMIANKTYSLPSSYNPGGLTGACSSAFASMQADAAAEGLNIYVASGFRSYSLQESIYNRYCARDGQAEADTYSARPGHSEHQTGLAIDLNDISSAFANTAEGKWVAENCHKYGFILRYPASDVAKTGYMYEPWHIRYIGVDAATRVYESGLCLEDYLGISSSYQDNEVG